MKHPVEISWRNVKKSEKIKSLIDEKAKKLDQISDDVISCRVTLEKPQKHLKTGRIYQVRVEIAVPREKVISVQKDAGKGNKDEKLEFIIRNTFQSAWRQLREHTRKLRGNIKSHPIKEARAFFTNVLSEDGHGFAKAEIGREIFFYQNSIFNNEFNHTESGA